MSDPRIKRYAFKVPILFEGDRGSGKTFESREFAKTNHFPCLEVAGNESIESFDFLGHVVQTEHGMVWKDGKLSQAFRLAAKGIQVVLIIDEMLRIPQRHLSVLLSALSPDSDGNYRLQTGRMNAVIDGVGVEEELLAPTTNLAIFATTNVGPEFAIDDLDPAVAERFIIIRKDTEIAQLTKILQAKAESRSFNRLVVLKLVELFNKTQRMVKTGTLNRHATTRTLARALEAAESEQDIKLVLKDQILLWADRDSSGLPVKQQTDMLEKTINELFSDMPKPQAAKEPKKKPSPSATTPPPKSTRKTAAKTTATVPAPKPKPAPIPPPPAPPVTSKSKAPLTKVPLTKALEVSTRLNTSSTNLTPNSMDDAFLRSTARTSSGMVDAIYGLLPVGAQFQLTGKTARSAHHIASRDETVTFKEVINEYGLKGWLEATFINDNCISAPKRSLKAPAAAPFKTTKSLKGKGIAAAEDRAVEDAIDESESAAAHKMDPDRLNLKMILEIGGLPKATQEKFSKMIPLAFSRITAAVKDGNIEQADLRYTALTSAFAKEGIPPSSALCQFSKLIQHGQISYQADGTWRARKRVPKSMPATAKAPLSESKHDAFELSDRLAAVNGARIVIVGTRIPNALRKEMTTFFSGLGATIGSNITKRTDIVIALDQTVQQSDRLREVSSEHRFSIYDRKWYNDFKLQLSSTEDPAQPLAPPPTKRMKRI